MSGYSFRTILCDVEVEVEEILREVRAILDRYKRTQDRMRQMTAADLCDVCGLGGIHNEWLAYPETPPTGCPNCHHQTPAERVIEAARAVGHIRMLARNDGSMTMTRGWELKGALNDLDEALADLDRQGEW